MSAAAMRSAECGIAAVLVLTLSIFFVRRRSMPQLLAGIRFVRGIWREFLGRVRAVRVVRGSADGGGEATGFRFQIPGFRIHVGDSSVVGGIWRHGPFWQSEWRT